MAQFDKIMSSLQAAWSAGVPGIANFYTERLPTGNIYYDRAEKPAQLAGFPYAEVIITEQLPEITTAPWQGQSVGPIQVICPAYPAANGNYSWTGTYYGLNGSNAVAFIFIESGEWHITTPDGDSDYSTTDDLFGPWLNGTIVTPAVTKLVTYDMEIKVWTCQGMTGGLSSSDAVTDAGNLMRAFEQVLSTVPNNTPWYQVVGLRHCLEGRSSLSKDPELYLGADVYISQNTWQFLIQE